MNPVRGWRLFLTLAALFFAACFPALAEPVEPFPDLLLPAPGADADYLGIAYPDKPFRLCQVRARGVLLVLSGFFCGPCHKEAVKLNEVRELIKKRGLDHEVKIITISAGDDARQAQRFKELRSMAYPIFPDPDLVLHKDLGSLPVPALFVLRLGPDVEQVMRVSGLFPQSPADFLDLVIDKLDIR